MLDGQHGADALRCGDDRSSCGRGHVRRLRERQLSELERRDGVLGVRGGVVLRGGRVGSAAVSIGLILERHRLVARRQLHGVLDWPLMLDR